MLMYTDGVTEARGPTARSSGWSGSATTSSGRLRRASWRPRRCGASSTPSWTRPPAGCGTTRPTSCPSGRGPPR
nr:hypothetical protein [Streptomyces caelestis]